MSILDFFTPEAGQARRRALSRVDQKISDALGYYLGPQLAPRVEQAANIAGLLSPGQDVQDAYTASGELMAPNRSLLDRAASGAALAGAVGAMVMPGGVSSIRQGIDDLAEAGVRAYDPNTTNAFTVWHASPHDFDRFDMSKIGTGEGAQAYGHGLYFAESPEVSGVGGTYFRDFIPRVPVADDLSELLAQVDDLGYSSPAAARNVILTDQDWRNAYGIPPDVADKIEAAIPGSAPRVYEVSIDAEPEDFLDWDRPLSEQSEVVRAWFDSRGITPGFAGQQSGNELFQAERRAFDDEKALAESLRNAGVKGVRYLDHGSRFNAVDGIGPQTNTSNYVVFNDQLLSILNKYGLAGGAVLGAGALAMQPGEAQAQPASVGDILWQQEQAKRLRDYLEAVQ